MYWGKENSETQENNRGQEIWEECTTGCWDTGWAVSEAEKEVTTLGNKHRTFHKKKETTLLGFFLCFSSHREKKQHQELYPVIAL